MVYNLKQLEKIYTSPGVINYIKSNWGSGKIKKTLSVIVKKEEYKNEVIKSLFPQNADELHVRLIGIEEISLSKQMIWAANVLYLYRKDINLFLKLKDKFEVNLITGDFKNATDVLEEIKKNFGVSYWYYESKLLLNEYENSSEYNDITYKQMFEEFEKNVIGKAIIFELNSRLQLNFLYSQFEREVARLINLFKEHNQAESPVVDYIIFKIDPFYPKKNLNLAEILNCESYASLIDYYLTFEKILYHLVEKIEDNDVNALVSNILKTFDGEIENEVIRNLHCIIDGKEKTFRKSNTKVLDILDKYTIGRYKECIEICKEAIREKRVFNEVLEIYPRCIIKSDSSHDFKELDNSVLDIYIRNKILIDRRSENLQHLLNNLNKIAADFSCTGFGRYVGSMIVNEYSQISSNRNELDREFINYSVLNPILYDRMPESKKIKIINTLSSIYNDSQTVKLYKAIWSKDVNLLHNLNLPKDRFMKYYSRVLIEEKKYKEAIDIYEELELSCDAVDLNEIVSGLVHCYINLDKIEDSIKLVIKYLLDNSNLCVGIPLLDIINKASKSLKCHLSLSIFYSLCIRNIAGTEENNKDLNDKIFDEYENYLDSIGIIKPSGMFGIEMNKELLYFLENVCTINIMSNSVEFNETADAEEERIQILNFLIKYHKENHKECNSLIDNYLKEMSNLSERKLLRKSVSEVGKNKIVVDIEKIKIEINKDLKDKYYKYIHNANFSNKDIEYVIQNITDDETEEKIIGHTPKDQNIYLLYAIIFELRDLFATQLDCCLGTEIRHGKLVAQLRVPFEKEHIITTKDKNTGKYISNQYWISKYSNLSKNDTVTIDKHLIDFTQKLYNLFNEVKNKWIQINNEKRDNGGLFDFRLEIDSLESIKDKITINSNFEEFVEHVFDMLWLITNKNLLFVREKIKRDLNRIINKECITLLKDLSSDLSSENKAVYAELFNAIKCAQTEAQYNLELVSEWFKISDKLEGKPYVISHAVNVAREILTGMHPNNKIKINTDIDDKIMLPRRSLNNFVNIFFTILENSITHKGKEDIETELYIKTIDQNTINIEFINNIGYDAPEEEVIKVKKINEKLIKDVTDKDIIEEGGTGFLKIRKILAIDLSCRVININLTYEKSLFLANILFEMEA